MDEQEDWSGSTDFVVHNSVFQPEVKAFENTSDGSDAIVQNIALTEHGVATVHIQVDNYQNTTAYLELYDNSNFKRKFQNLLIREPKKRPIRLYSA